MLSSGHLTGIIIVAIVMIAVVLKAKYRSHGAIPAAPDPESERLREEVKTLKDRVKVLERIATDRENSLDRQIEELRDR